MFVGGGTVWGVVRNHKVRFCFNGIWRMIPFVISAKVLGMVFLMGDVNHVSIIVCVAVVDLLICERYPICIQFY